jgi:hypothetical protein
VCVCEVTRRRRRRGGEELCLSGSEVVLPLCVYVCMCVYI